MLVHSTVPACLEVSEILSDSKMSLVNLSKDLTSFSITLNVPSSSDELTSKQTKKSYYKQILLNNYYNNITICDRCAFYSIFNMIQEQLRIVFSVYSNELSPFLRMNK